MTGFFHEAAFYGSDDDFLELVVPFLEDGLRAGEPTVVACGELNTSLLHDALGHDNAVMYLRGADQYLRPTDAIADYRDLFREHTASGARQMRVVGDVPHPGVGSPWDWWARYEAAANQAFAEFPVWGLCPYDTRTTPDNVLDDVLRTHPNVATRGEHRTNPDFREGLPRTTPAPDLLEQATPLIELVDPTAGAVREAVSAAISATDLTEDGAHDVVYAASEVVTNGLTHGVAPVRFRLWADDSRVVVAVTDQGTGPADPLAGLVPSTESRSAGLGLWILHRTCDYVSMGRDADGFTVRVSVGGHT